MNNVYEMSPPTSVKEDQKIEIKIVEKTVSDLSNENVIVSNTRSNDNLSISTSFITSDDVAAHPKLLSFLKVGGKDNDNPTFSNLNISAEEAPDRSCIACLLPKYAENEFFATNSWSGNLHVTKGEHL